MVNLNVAKKREITLQVTGVTDHFRDDTQQDVGVGAGTGGALELFPGTNTGAGDMHWDDDDPLIRDQEEEDMDAIQLPRRDATPAPGDIHPPHTPATPMQIDQE